MHRGFGTPINIEIIGGKLAGAGAGLKMRTDHLAVFLLFAPLANPNPKVNLCCRQNHAYKLHDEITTTKEHRCDDEPQVA